MANGMPQGFGNAGAPTVQPETEEERQRRIAQSQGIVGPPHTESLNRDPLVWGGRRENIDENGNPVAGTSSLDEDLNRFESKVGPKYVNGPQIDRTASDETRGIGIGSLGLLGDRARGAYTPAQALAAQQTGGAVNAVQSGAASIRGGAMARAAAARGAVATGARIQAQGNEDQAALRAREMAEAAGQYNTATTAQRGTDLGLAGSQANLEAAQRAQNAGREQFYEGLGYNTQKARADALLGRSAADEAASNAGRTQSLNEQQADRARTQQIASTAVGGATGLASGYNAMQGGQTPAPTAKPAVPGYQKPYDPNDTSDYRAKTNVRDLSTSGMESKTKIGPVEAARLREEADLADVEARGPAMATPRKSRVSDADAAKMKAQAANMIAGYRAQTFKPFTVTHEDGRTMRIEKSGDDFPEYDGKYLSPPFRDRPTPYDEPDVISGADKGARRDADTSVDLDAAMRAGTEDATPYAPQREGSLFGGKMGQTAARGYANARKGQPGYMFGGAPQADYGRLKPDNTSDFAGQAPGTADFYDTSGKKPDKFSQDVMLSDPRAKQAAYAAGAKDAWSGRLPEPPKPADDHSSTGVRDLVRAFESPKGEQKDEPDAPPAIGGKKQDAADREALIHAAVTQGRERREEAAKAALPPIAAPPPPQAKASAVERATGAIRGYVQSHPRPSPGAVLPFPPRRVGAPSSLDPGMPSDVRSKSDADSAGPMADAMRSMEPSVYEYKPKYAAEAGQEPHEKNVGPMAQNMAADPVAKTAITTRPDGMLAIDKDKALKLALGSLADLQMQVDAMKKGKAA